MIDFTKIYYFVFGALTILGGVIGFVKASSMPSLIAGSVAGLAMIIAGVLLTKTVQWGLVLGLVISCALAFRFVPAFMATQKFMPAGMMAVLSCIGVIVTIAAFIKR